MTKTISIKTVVRKLKAIEEASEEYLVCDAPLLLQDIISLREELEAKLQ